MNAELLKSLGQVAGIGGVSLGVLLILFKNLIQKSILQFLKKDDAYKLLRLITLLVWALSVLGIGAWLIAEYNAPMTITNGVGAGRDLNVNGNIVIDNHK